MGSKKLPQNKNSAFSQYMSDYPIYDTLRGQQHGIQYDNSGFRGKIGVDNTYNKDQAPMNEEDMKLHLAAQQKMGDAVVFGDVAMKSAFDPVGRLGVTYKPNDNTKLRAMAYNYDDTRGSHDLKDKTTLELKLKQKIAENLWLNAKASARNKGGLRGYEAGVQYKKKF